MEAKTVTHPMQRFAHHYLWCSILLANLAHHIAARSSIKHIRHLITLWQPADTAANGSIGAKP